MDAMGNLKILDVVEYPPTKTGQNQSWRALKGCDAKNIPYSKKSK